MKDEEELEMLGGASQQLEMATRRYDEKPEKQWKWQKFVGPNSC